MGSNSTLTLPISLVAVTFVCLATISILRRGRAYLYYSNGCLPPAMYAHKDPFLGLDLFVAQLKARQAGISQRLERERFAKYGKTYEMNSWGSRVIVTMEEENMRTVLSQAFADFGVEPLRLKTGQPFIGKGVFSTDGPYWEHSRRILRPIFGRKQVTDLHALEIHVTRFLEKIPKDGSTIDLQDLSKRMFLDHSTEMIFGISTETLLAPKLDEDANELLRTFSAALNRLGLRIVLGRLQLFQAGDTKYRELARKVHNVIDKYIDEAIKRRDQNSSSEGNDTKARFVIVDELVATTESREEIRDQLINIFLPARDASGVGLSGVLFLLARHPDVWEKLRSEVLKSDDALTYNTLQSMPYLKAVLNESFRLLTPASRNMRIALKATILPRGGGPEGKSPIYINKGDHINLNFGAMHYDPDIWCPNISNTMDNSHSHHDNLHMRHLPVHSNSRGILQSRTSNKIRAASSAEAAFDEAASFKPERWLRPDAPAHTWQYIPFSAGPRVCPGRQMALTEIGYVLARMARLWVSIENRDEVWEFVEENRLTTESRNGVKVAVKWA